MSGKVTGLRSSRSGLELWPDDPDGHKGPAPGTSHPAFVCSAPSHFYSQSDEFAPFGNDSGPDMLGSLHEWYLDGMTDDELPRLAIDALAGWDVAGQRPPWLTRHAGVTARNPHRSTRRRFSMKDEARVRALTVGTWLTIDAVLDNAISNLLDEGLSAHAPDVVGVQSLRERGWAVRAAHPERGLGPGGWPPREVRFDVALSDDDLDRLTDLLRHATVTTRQLLESDLPPTVRTLQEESLVHAQEAQEALDAIRRVR